MSAGMSMMAFNYRGVSHSKGSLVQVTNTHICSLCVCVCMCVCMCA